MAAEQGRQFAVVTGASSSTGFGRVISDSVKTEKHREMAEPGSAEQED
jgi:hypothetical protein